MIITYWLPECVRCRSFKWLEYVRCFVAKLIRFGTKDSLKSKCVGVKRWIESFHTHISVIWLRFAEIRKSCSSSNNNNGDDYANVTQQRKRSQINALMDGNKNNKSRHQLSRSIFWPILAQRDYERRDGNGTEASRAKLFECVTDMALVIACGYPRHHQQSYKISFRWRFIMFGAPV